jgi:hypothetical protein
MTSQPGFTTIIAAGWRQSHIQTLRFTNGDLPQPRCQQVPLDRLLAATEIVDYPARGQVARRDGCVKSCLDLPYGAELVAGSLHKTSHKIYRSLLQFGL